MTRFQALYVAFLRLECKSNGSWRWVAARYYDRYDKKIPFLGYDMTYGGNQIDGMYLCAEAGKILKINLDE